MEWSKKTHQNLKTTSGNTTQRHIVTFQNTCNLNNSTVETLNLVFIAFFLDFLTLEDGNDRLSRNASTELALYAA
jgi:hypothetical protein